MTTMEQLVGGLYGSPTQTAWSAGLLAGLLVCALLLRAARQRRASSGGDWAPFLAAGLLGGVLTACVFSLSGLNLTQAAAGLLLGALLVYGKLPQLRPHRRF